MKGQSVIKFLPLADIGFHEALGQAGKIGNRQRGLFVKKRKKNDAFVGFHFRIQAIFQLRVGIGRCHTCGGTNQKADQAGPSHESFTNLR